MLERTHIFVDTSYLLASFYNSWETGARAQLEIDLPEVVRVLGTMVQQQLNQPVYRQFWYDGIPETGPHRYQRALRTCDGVQLRAGQLIEWGDRRTQKAVDTRLVADMVLTAVRREVTDIVLVSGDADMIPGVQEAVNHGIRVHLYGFSWDSTSSALRHACDSTVILDPRMDFEDCMQLQVLEGPLPPRIHTDEDNVCDEDVTSAAQAADASLCDEASDESRGAIKLDQRHLPSGDFRAADEPSDAEIENRASNSDTEEVLESSIVSVQEQPHPARTTADYATAPAQRSSEQHRVIANAAQHYQPQAASPATVAPAQPELRTPTPADRGEPLIVPEVLPTADQCECAKPIRSITVTSTSVAHVTEAGRSVSVKEHIEYSSTDTLPAETAGSAAATVVESDVHEPAASSQPTEAPSAATPCCQTSTPSTVEPPAEVPAVAVEAAAAAATGVTAEVPAVAVEAAAVETANASASAETKSEPTAESAAATSADEKPSTPSPADISAKRPAPNPSMMAPRRKLRSRYVPLPHEVWTSAGVLTPFDVGQQYAIWWYENAATSEQRDSAHLLSGGGLPPEIDRPLLQFACETLHEYTLTEAQRVNLRDGFHSGIRGVLLHNS